MPLGFCQVLGSPSRPQRLSVDAGITFPPDTLLPQMDAPYRLSKGRESLSPECKVGGGGRQQSGVLGKEDPFLDHRCIFWMTLAIFRRTVWNKADLLTAYGCSS